MRRCVFLFCLFVFVLKEKKNTKKNFYRQLLHGVKCSVGIFHTAYHKQLFFYARRETEDTEILTKQL